MNSRAHSLPPENKIDGLSASEAAARLKTYGPNALPEKKKPSAVFVFLNQFRSPLIYLLFVAALMASFLGDLKDAMVIMGVVVINAVVGALQEGKAEKSLEALRKLSVLQVKVLRDGKEQSIVAHDLVPDDVLVFAAGDAIGADARVFETARLAVAEAALTGESVPVEKHTRVLDVHTPVPDRRNMVYAGTHVTSGRGRAVVVATGVETEVGKIAVLTQSAEEPKTPLEMRIAQFGRYLIYAAVFLFVFIVGLGWLRDVSFVEIVMIGISQVVSMIPAGLPVALTIALAVGVQRMAARNTIVRRLSAVETLGSTNIICSDKTGTLTKNEMTVTSVCLPDGRSVDVGGDVNTDPQLKPLFEALALCNDAQLRTGDPTETSLITLALKAKIKVPELRRSFPRLAEIPFDPDVKMMATQHRKGSGNIVYVKGAPEVVLRLCRGLAPDDLRRLENVVADMAERSLRVLAAAKIENMAGLITDFVLLRGKAEFIGLVGQLDPPRPEVKVAVDECKKAGIRPVMVTGDHKSTGWAIARELGIAREGDLAVDGVELDRMDDRVLLNCLDRIAVFARVHPAQKLRIVEAYQAKKAVVAMTGDGVNDAPALARANVGVAMGITGTEVAKEAAKIVIADDNFATIVKAVEEGRLIYRNIKKLILYLFSTSAAEIVILVAALLAGYPPPLVAVQILWVNLVTDGAVTVTLIMEPLEGDEMKQSPVPSDEPLVTSSMLRRMLLVVPAMAVSTLGYFIFLLSTDVPFIHARTAAFTVLAATQWFNVLNCRSERESAFRFSFQRNKWLMGGLAAGIVLQMAVVYFPPLNSVFHTVPLPLNELLVLLFISSLVFWVEEIRKFFVRRRREN